MRTLRHEVSLGARAFSMEADMLTSYDWLSARIHVFEGEPADVRLADADR